MHIDTDGCKCKKAYNPMRGTTKRLEQTKCLALDTKLLSAFATAGAQGGHCVPTCAQLRPPLRVTCILSHEIKSRFRAYSSIN